MKSVVTKTCVSGALLCLMFASCGEGYAPLKEPQKSDCTVGLAMGTATPDGRPICWKNRDWTDGANNHIMYDDSGTYTYVGIGSTTSMMGLNETGLSVGNSVAFNLDEGVGSDSAAIGWALQNASTIDEVRQAVIAETEGTDSYWSGRGASGTYPFMDSLGDAVLFEIGSYSYYEYDPNNPNRLAQFPMQVIARANQAHLNTDHTDDNSTGGDRYTEARDMMVERAESGGITIEEMIQVARRGEPGGYHLISNYMTLSTQLNHGVLAGEDPRIATMWASVGQPDYCIFVPVWVAAGDSLSDRLTSRNNTTGLAGRSWEIYDGMDNSDYDDYVNALNAGFQANLLEAGQMVREHWFATEFNVEQADALTDEAAETAWHNMNSMANGSGRNLNEPPELTALDIQLAGGGYTFNFSRSASDPDGSLVGTDWDFGDGTGDSGDSVTHEYLQAGTFLVRCRVEDDEGSRNSKWIYLDVPVGPVCGDGVVNQGEACDPGAPLGHICCDPVTCQWIANGQADPQSVCTGAPDCLQDVCDGAGSCTRVNLADGTPCADDGQYCTGSEICSAGACLSGGNPCPGNECNNCNEAADNCFDPTGTTCLSDDLFCTGSETCDGAGNCVSSGDPCPGTECNQCNEAADSCLEPAGTACTSDGLFCTGAEECDGSGNCASGGDPCSGEAICDEQQDLCLGCQSDEGCPLCQFCSAGVCQNQQAGSDQKDECPEARCLLGSCDGAGACGLAAEGTSCADTNVCNGSETCDSQGLCQAGETLSCDDGRFCNGLESCDPALGCQTGDDPCDDQDPCTLDSCDDNDDPCTNAPNPACGDGGTLPDGGQEETIAGGCSCGVGKRSAERPLHLFVLLAGLLAVWNRRRR